MFILWIALIKINLQPLFTLNPESNFIIIFMQGFPETCKLFQGFLQGKKVEKAGLKTYIQSETVTRQLWSKWNWI
jgi:hypothetical protein